ncbi:MAG: UDP-N-acetylmuramoyl-L-alanyl-D-glutamate--2,6-diaminopimelate ligase [Beijerinckiaceae bacterium]|jgi:UDP-N-acetylmuramoyl-L-alanyl-D-glutamate--2,6-diaminopimelate ligase|nr:UDP-N-acetylmuramoyl-L-alanyl-D-glutamate--2,6-diaminopimelate ligase [Beijerinckiaceae bacterium]
MANAEASEPTIGGLARALGLDAPAYDAVPLLGVVQDSRKVKPGFAFFAIPGNKADGAAFMPAAAEAGATVIVGEIPRPPDLTLTAFYLRVKDARKALSRAARYMHPGQPETIVAVTGTAGKTSVADFTRQIFARLKHKAGSLGTLGFIGPDGPEYGSLTTPDPVTLHARLDAITRAGVTHLAMEASSHGLDQFRLDGVQLKAAAFTNLGRDHLDYHPDMDHYFAAKLRLFQDLLPKGAPAIVNLDGDRGAEAAVAAGFAGRSVFTVGRRGEDIRLVSATPSGFGQDLELVYKDKSYVVHLPLIGGFQVQNALVAAGFALVMGEKPKAVFAAFEHLRGVPGRLEKVGERNGAPVFVDYAHKPEALEHALSALRPAVRGKLIVIFGCGGDRDPGKRPIMGAIASQKADLVIVTDDNPRSENPAAIRQAVLAGAPDGIEIGDRAQAIRDGIRYLTDGDALLIAGKGHETGQIVGSEVLPFSDHEVARGVIEELSE